MVFYWCDNIFEQKIKNFNGLSTFCAIFIFGFWICWREDPYDFFVKYSLVNT